MDKKSNKIDVFISKSDVLCIESADRKLVNIHHDESLINLKPKLKNYYETVSIYYVSSTFTVLPEELFSTDKKREILEFTTHLNEGDNIRSSVLLPFNTHVIWSISAQLESQVATIFPNAIFHHIVEKGIQLLFGSNHDFLTIEIANSILNVIKQNGKLQQVTLNKAKTINDKMYFSLLPFQKQPTKAPQMLFVGSKELLNQLQKYLKLEIFESMNNYDTLLK